MYKKLILIFCCTLFGLSCRKQPVVPKNIDPFEPLNNYIIGKWQMLDEKVNGYRFFIDRVFVATRDSIKAMQNDTDAYSVNLTYQVCKKFTRDDKKIMFDFTKDELIISNQFTYVFTNISSNHDTNWTKQSQPIYHLKRNYEKSTIDEINVTAHGANGGYFAINSYFGINTPSIGIKINKIDSNHLYLKIDGRYNYTEYNHSTGQSITYKIGALEEYKLEKVQ